MKNTRRSLFTSLITLLLCSTMFVGSTFAWFTDTVSNTGNKIQAGTLDVSLWKHNGTEFKNISDDKEPIFNYDKWEPGYSTGSLLKIQNDGNLSFKYKVIIKTAGTLEVNDEGNTLADAIDVYTKIVDSTFTMPESFTNIKGDSSWTKNSLSSVLTYEEGVAHGALLASSDSTEPEASKLEAKGSVPMAIVLHMREDAGNEYQGMSLGTSFDIQILATQYNYEKDGFNNPNYDVQAEYPVVAEAKYTSGQSTTLVAYGSDNKQNAKAVIPTDANIPAETTKIIMEIDDTDKPEAIQLEEGQDSLNVDISFYSVSSSGTKTQIKDFGTDKSVSVDLSTVIPNGHELVKVFNTHNPTNPTEFIKVTSKEDLSDGKFMYDSSTKTMYLSSSKFSPFTFVIEEANYEVIVTKDGDDSFTPVGMSLAEFRDSVNNEDYNNYEGYTVTLQKDVDLTGVAWEPIGYYYDYYSYNYSTWTSTTIDGAYKPFCGTFDGNNHIISKLSLTDPSWLGEATKDNDNYEDFYLGLFGETYGGEIKNLTIKDSTLVAGGYGPYGILVAEAYGTDITNCHIVNCDYTGLGMGGLICDYLYYGTMNGCSTDSNSSLIATGGSYSSGLVAYGYQAEIKNSINNANITGTKSVTGIVGNCNQTDVTNCINNGDIYSTGASANDSFVGGIAGTVSSGNVSYCTNNGDIETKGSNSPASGIVAQNCSGSVSNVFFCINTGDVKGAYAQSMAAGLYGSTPVENCYNSGTISGIKGTAGISQPVYSGTCNSKKCVNAESISTGTTHLSTGTNTNSYYYDGLTLKDSSNVEVDNIDNAIAMLNDGLSTPFWGKDVSGIIKPLSLIEQ